MGSNTTLPLNHSFRLLVSEVALLRILVILLLIIDYEQM